MRSALIVFLCLTMFVSTASVKEAETAAQDQEPTLSATDQSIAEQSPLARMIPYYKDGIRIGYQVSDIMKGSLTESIGLENGDVVVSINREKAQGLNLLMLLMFKDLKDEKLKSLRIIRQGKESTLRM